MAAAKAPPVQIELSEAQYLVLLKHAKGSSRVAARLLRVVEPETSVRKGKVDPYVFTGFVTTPSACALLRSSTPRTPCPRSTGR